MRPAYSGIVPSAVTLPVNAPNNPFTTPITVSFPYYDSYFAYAATAAAATMATTVLNQDSAKIPSQTYDDWIATYRFGASDRFANGLLDGGEVRARGS